MTSLTHSRIALLAIVCFSAIQCSPRPWPQRPTGGGPPQPQQPPFQQPPQQQPPVGQPTNSVRVSAKDAQRIGKKIWQNEAAGTVAGLTSWNKGEHFASLGIGHFIWYPAGTPQTFKESFRPLMGFLQSRGVRLPPWLTPQSPCP
ncbi:MAG: hypothetical protein ACKVHP_05390, partial [Verrucomicrobiales bacterium]